MNQESDWDALCACVDELIATGRFVSRHYAMLEAQRLHPELDPTPPGFGSKPAPAFTGTAEAQLNAAAKRISSAKGIPFAQAYVQALNDNPRLYEQYLIQHPQQTGARL